MRKKSLGIDFGASFVDAVIFDGKKIVFKKSVERKKYSLSFLANLPKLDKIIATGCHPRGDSLLGVTMKWENEFDCLARGGLFLSKLNSAVIVSAGTGTAVIFAQNPPTFPTLPTFSHLGGTGIGGGTLTGLGKLLLVTDKPEEIFALAQKGNRSKVDLTVGDILGQGIGFLSPEATAANFGKITKSEQRDHTLCEKSKKILEASTPGVKEPACRTGRLASENFTKEDLASALVAMIAETIGMVACLAAKGIKEKNLVFVGRLSTNKLIQKCLKEVCRLFNLKPLFPKDAPYATALGAAIL